mmetsp:Transcript_38915/g.70857  ORF Transcript_38915/g.70857 Transcript_38915/m.70857 type:complete len:204 (-) Transcript_38915:45-656(-)
MGVMGLVHRLNSPLVAAGGLAFVITMYIGAMAVEESAGCNGPEVSQCEPAGGKDLAWIGTPAEDLLEKRDGVYIARFRGGTVDRRVTTDYNPTRAYQYEPCSAVTGTMLTHMGTPVTNEFCALLGCSWRDCLRKTFECEIDNESQHMRFRYDEPQIECSPPNYNSDMSPAKFSAFFFALLCSISMCIGGCLSSGPDTRIYAVA